MIRNKSFALPTLLNVAVLCLIAGVILKVDRSLISFIGAPAGWLDYVTVADHLLFGIGGLMFSLYVMLRGRQLKERNSA